MSPGPTSRTPRPDAAPPAYSAAKSLTRGGVRSLRLHADPNPTAVLPLHVTLALNLQLAAIRRGSRLRRLRSGTGALRIDMHGTRNTCQGRQDDGQQNESSHTVPPLLPKLPATVRHQVHREIGQAVGRANPASSHAPRVPGSSRRGPFPIPPPGLPVSSLALSRPFAFRRAPRAICRASLSECDGPV